jgi:hypothetical protein
MKYTRMLCWVNKRTEKQFQELNLQYNIPINFVDTFENFEKGIQQGVFLVILRRKVDKNIRRIRKLLSSFENHIFYAYVQRGDPCTTPREFEFSMEKNVVVCDETDIFKLFQSL